jgi:hypothetical protein
MHEMRHVTPPAPVRAAHTPVVAALRATVAMLALLLVGAALANPIVVGFVLPDPDTAAADPLGAAVTRAAELGVEMAEDEHAFNAMLFGLDFAVAVERASGEAAVVAAADRLVDDNGALAVAGGFSAAEAAALAAWSAERGVAFLNVASSDDRLRHELCAPTAYHVEPSAAMYLDALAGWYVRSGFRSWFFVVGRRLGLGAQYERMLWSLRERHFGAREAAESPTTVMPAPSSPRRAARTRTSSCCSSRPSSSSTCSRRSRTTASPRSSPASRTRRLRRARSSGPRARRRRARERSPRQRLGGDARRLRCPRDQRPLPADASVSRWSRVPGRPIRPSRSCSRRPRWAATATPEGVMAYMAARRACSTSGRGSASRSGPGTASCASRSTS